MIANKNEFGGSHLNFIISKPIVSPSGLYFIVLMQGGLKAGGGTGGGRCWESWRGCGRAGALPGLPQGREAGLRRWACCSQD